MQHSALVVIDLQNDITKNYKEIIEKVNTAIDWAVKKNLWVITFSTTICLREQGLSSPEPVAQSLCRR